MNIPIDISETIIKTERMVLRPWREIDLEDFYEYASVDGVGQMAGWLPHESREKSKEILTMFIEEKKTFALEYNGKVIGSLGIEEYNEDEFPEFTEQKGRELGYVLSKTYWGQGLMPEAVGAVMDYLFDTMDLNFILCGHFTDNEQSKRVQEKCGFVHYKLTKHETRYGIVKDTWVSLCTREHICNYLDMQAEQQEIALNSLSSIGFYPAYGRVKTMQNIMDKSVPGQMPQFYFVLRDDELIGYMFLIGDEKRFRAFPWLSIDNLDELPIHIAAQMMNIAIKTWENAGNLQMAEYQKTRLDDYKCGVGRRNGSKFRQILSKSAINPSKSG